MLVLYDQFLVEYFYTNFLSLIVYRFFIYTSIMPPVKAWHKQYSRWFQVRDVNEINEFRCSICSERGLPTVWKEWRICKGN